MLSLVKPLSYCLQVQYTRSSSKLRVYINRHSTELFTKCLWKGLVAKSANIFSCNEISTVHWQPVRDWDGFDGGRNGFRFGNFCIKTSFFLSTTSLISHSTQAGRRGSPRLKALWKMLTTKSSELKGATSIYSFLIKRLFCSRGKEDDNDIVLYFDFWPKEEQCILLPLKLVIYQLSDKNIVLIFLLVVVCSRQWCKACCGISVWLLQHRQQVSFIVFTAVAMLQDLP